MMVMCIRISHYDVKVNCIIDLSKEKLQMKQKVFLLAILSTY